MWLSNRRFFLLGGMAAVGLNGCQFQPAWNSANNASALFGQIEIDTPTSRNEFGLREHLILRLGKSGAPKFSLNYSVSVSSSRRALSFNGKSYRTRLTGNARFSLHEKTSNKVVHSAHVSDSLSYSDAALSVADQASNRDANARLMILLGDKIVDSLLMTKDLVP